MSKAGFQEYSPGESLSHEGRNYRIGKRILHGKLSCVYACHDDWGSPRVLQVLWPVSASYENVRERWIAQTAELRRIRHPGLVHLFDGFEREGRFHLVHERCDHRLDQQIESPAWDASRWFKVVARPVLCALDEVHRHGYVHRNIHPRNVLTLLPLEQLQPDSLFSGAVKLSDLAAGTLIGKVDVLNLKISRWLVPPEYLSPSECGPMDHRMDIYQAGLLLLCLAVGHIRQYSFEEIATGQPAKDAEQLVPEHGPALARALRPRVEDRFESALDLWRALSGTEPLTTAPSDFLKQPFDLHTEYR